MEAPSRHGPLTPSASCSPRTRLSETPVVVAVAGCPPPARRCLVCALEAPRPWRRRGGCGSRRGLRRGPGAVGAAHSSPTRHRQQNGRGQDGRGSGCRKECPGPLGEASVHEVAAGAPQPRKTRAQATWAGDSLLVIGQQTGGSSPRGRTPLPGRPGRREVLAGLLQPPPAPRKQLPSVSSSPPLGHRCAPMWVPGPLRLVAGAHRSPSPACVPLSTLRRG